MIRHQYRERLCLTRAGVPFFVFVAFTLALLPLISQYSAFNGLPLSIQEAKAIKHKAFTEFVACTPSFSDMN